MLAIQYCIVYHVPKLSNGLNYNKVIHIMLQATTRGLAANTVLVLTNKPYNPSANSMQNNHASWATVQAFFKANKVVTYGALQKHLQVTHNHGNFVGWRYRHGNMAAKG